MLLLRDALRRIAHRTLGSRDDGEVAYAVVIAETTAVAATRGSDGTLVAESVNGWETDLAGTTSSGSGASGAANDVGSSTGAVSRRSIAAGVSSLVASTVAAAAETRPGAVFLGYQSTGVQPRIMQHNPIIISTKNRYNVMFRCVTLSFIQCNRGATRWRGNRATGT